MNALEILISQQLGRWLAKASCRGIEADLCNDITGNRWRYSFNASQVQARWVNRCTERAERRAWAFAKHYLPVSLFKEMTRPGERGIREALTRNSELRLRLMEPPKLTINQTASARILIDEVRKGLEAGSNECMQQNISEEIWWALASHCLINDLALSVQSDLEKCLDRATCKAQGTAKRSRL